MITSEKDSWILRIRVAAYGLGPGRGVNNVYFKNITYTGNANANQIYGYDSNRMIQNVTFENLKVNGNVITNASAGNFSINSYTNNINFIASGGSVPAPAAISSPIPNQSGIEQDRKCDSSHRTSGFGRKRRQHDDPLVCE